MTQVLAPPPPAGPPSRGSRLRSIDWRSYAIYIGFAVVFLLFAIFLADDGFLSGTNLLNIFRQTAIISVNGSELCMTNCGRSLYRPTSRTSSTDLL